MVQSVAETRVGPRDDVGFSRMQIAARQVAAQRPAVGPQFLPGGQSDRKFEQGADRGDVQRQGRDRFGLARRGEIRVQAVGADGERRAPRARELAQRIGLRVPVKCLRPPGEALEAVLGSRMTGGDETPIRLRRRS